MANKCIDLSQNLAHFALASSVPNRHKSVPQCDLPEHANFRADIRPSFSRRRLVAKYDKMSAVRRDHVTRVCTPDHCCNCNTIWRREK